MSGEELLCESTRLCLIDEIEEISRGVSCHLVTDRFDIRRDVSLCELSELVIVELSMRTTGLLYIHLE